MLPSRSWSLLTCGAVLFLAACSSPATGPTATQQPLTYRDVEPAFMNRCATCHVPGGVGPMPLTGYDEIKAALPSVISAVESGHMPPWPPAPGCTEYTNSRALTTQEKTNILSWADQGAPRGEPANLAPGTPKALSRVDLSLSMAQPYTQTVAPDEYRCFVLDWPETQNKYVTGFGVTPGQKRIVHHVIAYLIPPELVGSAQALDDASPGPGYPCVGASGVNFDPVTRQIPGWLGSWSPGDSADDFPAGTGILVRAGSKIVLQMHYNTTQGGPQPDKTSIQLKLDSTVRQPAFVLPFLNPLWTLRGGMPIPAGAKASRHFAGFALSTISQATQGLVPNEPLLIHNAGIHMHQLGSKGRLSIQKNSEETCMLDIQHWMFHWQDSYSFTTPKRIEPSDTLQLECIFDNSAENQPIVNGRRDPPRNVEWGEGTADEMCLGLLYMTRAN